MIIKFSRHVKRRVKLYKIPEATIREMLETKDLQEGEHEFMENISGFKFPIKIVVIMEGDVGTGITNYPFKKGRRK